jgi:tol-pal system protein YbgF
MRRLTFPAALLVLCAGAADPAGAANKDMERLQIQMAGLQGQIISLQRVVEESLREVKRLNESLAEQNAFLRRGIQDGRVHDEAIQTTLKEISERLGEMNERFQAARSVAPGPLAGLPEPTGPVAAAPAGPSAAAPPPRELYSQAYADFARGNYDLAIQEFQAYLKNYPETEFSDNAQYWIGECHFGKQRYADAVEAWNALLRDFPASDKLPDARVKKGRALEHLGRRSQALLEYRYVLDHYPNSPAARLARERLNP